MGKGDLFLGPHEQGIGSIGTIGIGPDAPYGPYAYRCREGAESLARLGCVRGAPEESDWSPDKNGEISSKRKFDGKKRKALPMSKRNKHGNYLGGSSIEGSRPALHIPHRLSTAPSS
jgi:hypothetical protein